MTQTFSVPFEGRKLVGDVMSDGKGGKPNSLFLHGAGNSNRERWQPLRQSLFERGVGSYAFDFIGHGETGGELISSSLERRTSQTLQVINTLDISSPLVVIGSSMGAYTALKVSEKIPIDTFIFLVPAMYDRNSYRVQFGPRFSEIIRKPKSWDNSDAWGILAKFFGKLLIIGAGKDEVVPKELIQKLYGSAPSATKRELYFVTDSSHALSQFLEEYPNEKDKVVSLIATFCR